MRFRPISELPRDHRSFRGLFQGETEDGQEFRLEVGQVRRRRNSGELMRAHINSMARGRPPSPADMYKDVVEIVLFLQDGRRRDIEALPSGMYRHGRHVGRTLPEIVARVAEEHGRHLRTASPKP